MKVHIFAIGGSAGSIKVLLQVLPDLEKPDFPVLIVLHRAPNGPPVLQSLLASYTKIPIFEAEDKTILESGCIYIAPADYHLLIEKDKSVTLDYSEKLNYSRPSIDVTFIFVAHVYKEGALALLLSGANEDGVNGLGVIKNMGGIATVQDPKTCEVEYMPLQAINRGVVDMVIRPDEIASFINKLSVK
ncbi:CheB methylesterase [Pseudopedobacter saltans DSM 12145]|uniref:protein-glutamate methylesterase n=1 Tax=Pseudopedobacter saltans (strain ATCC 51119 / DSM 12145 / JCM 21818 / CCUG 39354 / LMG 10337 / NBRC 100064 / NCIMB 13643) TaxID=762903 RepID=F0S5G6_PSESL|nr:chemotaxis protein CheB [Pseudopedobacter saltans]ADY53130.1 CheB methylesterase [Pseudopedobacter saltans DSM 12145]